MKRMLVFPLLAVMVLQAEEFGVGERVFVEILVSPADGPEVRRDPNNSDLGNLDGRDVVVRLYSNWQEAPASFQKVAVPTQGRQVRFELEGMVRSAVVAVVGEDQQDEVVKKALDDCIYADPSSKVVQFSLPFSGGRQGKWQTFVDALGNPIGRATVEMFLCTAADEGPRISVTKLLLDEKARLKMPCLAGGLNRLHLIVSHPDYGSAVVDRYLHSESTINLALVRKGTEAHTRAIWGVVVDSESNPVAGAAVRCTHVRTLGEGLINSIHAWEYKVRTDETGRFSFYLPNQKRRDDRGQLIPPKSEYLVRIEAPKILGLLAYEGRIENGRETMITLERGGYFRRFVFEDENGRVTDPSKLKRIHLVVKLPNEAQLSLEYDDWKDGGMFPLGTYHATGWRQTGEYEFERLEVNAESPEELVFMLAEGILYYGQVVHGLTGEPMAGAFVMGMGGSGKGNLSQITDEQWEALHALPANPSADEFALGPLRKLYGFKKIVRTDEDGRFEMSFRPGRGFYGFVFFEQNYIGVLHRKHALKPDEEGRAKVPVKKLFPAARVIVEPRVEEKHVSICPKWLIEKNSNPAWVSDFLAIDDRKESLFTYDKWLKQSEAQSFHVPAGLNLRVQLRAPYDRQWCPITIEQTINLQQGEVLDLGRHSFEPALEVLVRVINSTGEHIEGVPVRVLREHKVWSVPHNTDAKGIARFHVVPYCQGEFGVMYHSKDGAHLKEIIPYTVAGEEDAGREFTLQLSDEMLYHLFK